MNLENGFKYRESRDLGRERNVDEIMELVRLNLKKVMEKKRDSIGSHTYGAIMGTDSGGRIPALVLRKTLNSIYASRGQDNIGAVFFQDLVT